MNKQGLLKIAVLVLALCNLLWLVQMFFHKKEPNHHQGPRNIIIERLHFSAEQVAAYDQLIRQHRNNIRQQEDRLQNLKSAYYSQLKNGVDVALQDSLSRQIGNNAIEIERINYAHFQDIKKLCNTSQTIYFNELVDDLTVLFRRPQHEKHQP